MSMELQEEIKKMQWDNQHMTGRKAMVETRESASTVRSPADKNIEKNSPDDNFIRYD